MISDYERGRERERSRESHHRSPSPSRGRSRHHQDSEEAETVWVDDGRVRIEETRLRHRSLPNPRDFSVLHTRVIEVHHRPDRRHSRPRSQNRRYNPVLHEGAVIHPAHHTSDTIDESPDRAEPDAFGPERESVEAQDVHCSDQLGSREPVSPGVHTDFSAAEPPVPADSSPLTTSDPTSTPPAS